MVQGFLSRREMRDREDCEDVPGCFLKIQEGEYERSGRELDRGSEQGVHESAKGEWERGEGDVINYGIGGLYLPHHDYVSYYRKAKFENVPLFQNSGDRIATVILYLSDVLMGGATVFPKLNIHVPIVKGAAAVWYNLHRNGTPDTRLLHGGCPVIFGDKWISTKWIREAGQTFRRPCLLDPHL
eukprot:XP_014787031.1 PREDICTED: prolyl 4-hydroxylase subunit alpha-3-like [Octopus bimaculoides]